MGIRSPDHGPILQAHGFDTRTCQDMGAVTSGAVLGRMGRSGLLGPDC